MMTQTSKQFRRSRAGAGRAPAPPATPRQAASVAAPLDSLLDPGLFRALGDPTRVRIAACLCKCSRPCAVSEIAECCSVDLSVVSRHLSLLERHGVVESSKQGRTVFYRVRYEALMEAFRALAAAIETCWRACGPGVCGPGGSCCGPASCDAGASPSPRGQKRGADGR